METRTTKDNNNEIDELDDHIAHALIALHDDLSEWLRRRVAREEDKQEDRTPTPWSKEISTRPPSAREARETCLIQISRIEKLRRRLELRQTARTHEVVEVKLMPPPPQKPVIDPCAFRRTMQKVRATKLRRRIYCKEKVMTMKRQKKMLRLKSKQKTRNEQKQMKSEGNERTSSTYIIEPKPHPAIAEESLARRTIAQQLATLKLWSSNSHEPCGHKKRVLFTTSTGSKTKRPVTAPAKRSSAPSSKVKTLTKRPTSSRATQRRHVKATARLRSALFGSFGSREGDGESKSKKVLSVVAHRTDVV